MELELIFTRFNHWWDEEFEPLGIMREKYLEVLLKEVEDKNITFITGLRRVGKTTLIKQLIGKLLKKGLNKKTLFFISLDHSALSNLTILDIVEKYREMHQISVKEKIYLFFDEIQEHQHFERDLKILHDHENVKIFASGSNSLMLKDKGAFLTGRNKNIVINPLSFEEYLQFKGIKINLSDQQLVNSYFEQYLEMGGMPEYVLTQDPEKIISLVNNIIYKDIVGKHGLKNPAKLEALFLLLCERVGKRLTYNKLANIFDLDVETISSYVSYFEEAFLIYQVNRYVHSKNEIIRSPKKIYIADNGLRSVFVGFKDKGALWENLIYLKLKSLKIAPKISYYYENEHEVDFIVELPKQKRIIAVEAKYKPDVSDDDLKLFNKLKIKEKYLLKDYEDLKIMEKI